MIAQIIAIIILLLTITSLILAVKKVEGIPYSAKRILRISILFFVIWAILNNMIWLSDYDLISTSLRFSMASFNLAILCLFIFHEYENRIKWYTEPRDKSYIALGGLMTSLAFDPNTMMIIEDNEGSYILRFSTFGAITQSVFMLILLLHILRRLLKIYQASKFYELGRVNQVGFISAFAFLLILPLIIINLFVLDPTPYVLKLLAGVTIFLLTLIYSLFPISPVFHQQKLFSLFAIYEGGMPVFRFEFHKDPNTNIADLMVSGALFSGFTLIEDLFDQENPIQSLQFGQRVILLRRVQGLMLAIISEFSSSLLQLQMDQFAKVLDQYQLFNSENDFNFSLAQAIFDNINTIFLTGNHQADMKKLYTYPSTIN